MMIFLQGSGPDHGLAFIKLRFTLALRVLKCMQKLIFYAYSSIIPLPIVLLLAVKSSSLHRLDETCRFMVSSKNSRWSLGY